MQKNAQRVNEIIAKAVEKAHREIGQSVEPALTGRVRWPVESVIGPGLEGAIACESKVGYVNGAQGYLSYRGYDVLDLCMRSSFEEVSYLLLRGRLPTGRQIERMRQKLTSYRHIPRTLRLLMGFPVEKMNTMAALRLGTNLLQQECTRVNREIAKRDTSTAIGVDEDSFAMEVPPEGSKRAVYEFKGVLPARPTKAEKVCAEAAGIESCCHLIAGVPVISAAIGRVRQGLMPIEPDPDLGHAANYLYMITGRKPTAEQERIMDVALILHADHGMNASTFATLVVASTLSDIYLSIGAGIAALNGPLHGGANEQVIRMLERIGGPRDVGKWYRRQRAAKRKIMGFGHRVYKSYDPRARILGPIAHHLGRGRSKARTLLATAREIEKVVIADIGKEKKIYPNVDFYSGLVYASLGVPLDLFTPTFAVARVTGWTSRVLEYLGNNRIFRPRAVYTGKFNRQYVPVEKRG